MTHYLQRVFAALVSRVPNTRDEKGQTFVEYALVLVLVAVAVSVLGAWTDLDTAIGDALKKVADAL